MTLRVIERYFDGFTRAFTPSSIASTFLLGSGVLATLWSIVLSLHAFYVYIVFGIVITFALIGCRFILKEKSGIRTTLSAYWQYLTSLSLAWKGIICLTATIILQTAIVSLSPLQSNGDAAAYYMVLPKLFNETHTFSLLRGYETFMTIGIHGELHFASLMSLGSDWGAKLITWPIGIACAIILAEITKIVGASTRAQIITIAMVYTSTAYILLIGDGKTDLFGAAMGCAAFLWLIRNDIEFKSYRYLIVGLFTGFAIIAKISYLPVIIPCIFLFTIWNHFTEKENKISSKLDGLSVLGRNIIWILIGLTLPGIIHVIKNWLLFGEPFAPFFYIGNNLFPDRWVNQSWFSPEDIRKIILTYPLALIFGKYPMQYGNLSVLLLAFAPLLILIPRSRESLNSIAVKLLITGVAGVIIWIIIRPGAFAPRYILFLLLFFIPIVSWSIDYVLSNEKRPRILSTVISLIFLSYLIVFNGLYAQKVAERFDKNTERQSLIKASTILNELTDSDDRVLSLSPFTYWLKSEILLNLATAEEADKIVNSEEKSSTDIWNLIYDFDFDYVLIDKNTDSQLTQKLFTPFANNDFVVNKIFQEQHYSIFEVKSKESKI